MLTDLTLFQPQEMSFDMPQVDLPRIRIDTKTGEFVHDYGDRWHSLEAVIIKAHDQSRVMWPSDFKRGNQPLCKSVDGRQPVERDPDLNPYGSLAEDGRRSCLGCPQAEWVETPAERLKPACAEVVNLLLVEIETEMPGVLSLARTRYRTGQNLSSFWAMTNFRFTVRLTTHLEKGPSGEWYMVEFQRSEKLSREQSRALATLHQQTSAWRLAALASELTVLDIEEQHRQLANGSAGMSLPDRVEVMRGPAEAVVE